MYPDQPQPYQPQSPQPSPLSYLDQIAPQSPQRSGLPSGMKLLVLIGASLVAAVLIIVVVLNVINGARKGPLEQLSAKINATQTIVDGAQANLKSSQLRSQNSNLRLALANTARTLTEPLAKQGVDTAKLPAHIVQEASPDPTLRRLEDARLNAVYDRTYAREMAFQMANVLALLQKSYNATNSTSLKETLKATYDDFLPIQETFADFEN